jgi:SAM-dependent methyltransferase
VPTCPVCSGSEFSTLVDARVIQQECDLRARFIESRLSHPVAPDQRKDLTDFFHSGKADIAVCSECSLLLRREIEPPPAQSYSADEYDRAAIEAVYPQYLSAFRAKEQPYRSLLPSSARVIEVGSHYGAFLQTAREWGWDAEGVDIGRDTSRFARSNGFTVHVKELPECDIPDSSRDAVFIWNCFEQIPDPSITLREAHRVLKPGGLLLARTPNGLFYSMCHVLINGNSALPIGSKELLTNAMAYNNLLGFPYLYGHRRSTLNRLIGRFGFRFENGLNSELLTLPLPDSPAWVEHQEQAINDEIRLLARSILADTHGVLTGPWIEVWYRRL